MHAHSTTTITLLDRTLIQSLLDDLPVPEKGKLCDKLGISLKTLSRRLKSTEELPYPEMIVCHSFLEDYSGQSLDRDRLTSPLREMVA